MVFPDGGPLPRHPSQLYEAALEGWCFRRAALVADPRRRARRRGFAHRASSRSAMASRGSSASSSASPTRSSAFSSGGLTMGMLLSLPMMLAGVGLISGASRRASRGPRIVNSISLSKRNPPAHRSVAARCPSPNTWRCAWRTRRTAIYVTRDPLGAGGDFITAPEISQLFGELIGLWAATVWQALGEPVHLHLVDLAPVAAPTMRDALRAAQIVPDFLASTTLHLVEVSPVLMRRQRRSAQRLRRTDRLAPIAGRRAGRQRHHHRQRILRCGAGAAGGETEQRLA